ncbi:sulfite reductase flavoprotein subunit alpha [Cupriavidus sp. AU9028]|uniref:flavodoxin domain-containing protein n=1 Tax=Cupriavidus sp. AU9028 TaxID=2871157 RepID=UPI001C95170F|nr:sulfite reductase flavoprotein subunit alpha [Cupriavidus sp. AU9028]MBY4896905.1 sulfite reductase flavoprotein subunit alpha [Cupriavidus sp. AU9028]
MSGPRISVATALAALAFAGGVALAVVVPERLASAGGVTLAYAGFCAGIVDLHRRKRRRGPSAMRAGSGDDALLVAYASQTGFGEQIAARTADSLQQAGIAVSLQSFADLQPAHLATCRRALFIVSTTGEGDAPDSASGFGRKLAAAARLAQDRERGLPALRYGVLALGDSSYANYCAFGHAVSGWLQREHAQPLFDLVEVDNGDPGALRHWQNHLSTLAGGTQIADWERPRYERWRLESRQLANAGSAGAPAFHLRLVPADSRTADDGALSWSAGDIAEIGPRLPPHAVQALLHALALDGDTAVQCDGAPSTLREALATRLPFTAAQAQAMRGVAPQALVDALAPLPHREYSIASLPADGAIELLVRQTRHADGGLGVGSGWLTEYAQPGQDIALRVRVNRGFHPPGDERPLILIGNGTGIAGLRALLKARAQAGHRRNWLLFGERSAATDAFYDEELRHWQAQGVLSRIDRTWSRDGGQLRYVQDAVRQAGDTVREWIAAGATIQVCGSLQGMASGVHEALEAVLGSDGLAALAESGRYRRDVY